MFLTSKLAAFDRMTNCIKGNIKIIGSILLFLKICLNSFWIMNSIVFILEREFNGLSRIFKFVTVDN